jgi:Rod binding domain-containing protein
MASISPFLTPAPPAPQTGAGASQPSKSDPAKIEQAAKGFESLLISQILKSSHAAGSSDWLGSGDDDDPSGDTATELAEEQFAQALASGGGLGLAKLITQGLVTESKAREGS